MRDFDWYGLRVCRLQAKVFAGSLEYFDCSSQVFIRRFMNSEIAKLFDLVPENVDVIGVEHIYLEIEKEYGESDYGSEKFGKEELYWIGYIYRYWAYTKETKSSKLYKIIKPNELAKLYYPYHTMDPAAAIERILEAKGIKDKDYLTEGVKIMRRVLNNYKI